MASEPSAAQRIRDSIAALPEDVKTGPWTARGTRVRIVMGNGGSTSVLDTRLEDDVTDCEPVAKFSALMDPTVAEAVANLLKVIARADYDNPSSTIEHIEDAAAALEAAINREQT